MSMLTAPTVDVRALRERIETLEEENRQLREAVTGRPEAILALKTRFGLTAQEARVLHALSRKGGALLPALQVAAQPQAYADGGRRSRADRDGEISDPATIRVVIHRLRKKLASHGIEVRNFYGGYDLPEASREKIKSILSSKEH